MRVVVIVMVVGRVGFRSARVRIKVRVAKLQETLVHKYSRIWSYAWVGVTVTVSISVRPRIQPRPRPGPGFWAGARLWHTQTHP